LTLIQKYANNGIRVFLKGGDLQLNTKQIIGWVLVIGAINWGLVGILNLNIVETILGAGTMLTKAVYILIGLAGAYKAYILAGGKK